MIDIVLDGDLGAWSRAFNDFDERMRDATPAMDKIGQYLTAEARGNMELSGGGVAWKPLSPVTLKRNPRPGDKPLIVSHALIDSLTHDPHPQHVDQGSSLPYARLQFYGGVIKGKMKRGKGGKFTGRSPDREVPARPPWNWVGGVMDRVGLIILEWILGGRDGIG